MGWEKPFGWAHDSYSSRPMIRRTKIKLHLTGKTRLIFNSASSLVIVASMESREILRQYECGGSKISSLMVNSHILLFTRKDMHAETPRLADK
jgi:hypothetical protein